MLAPVLLAGLPPLLDYPAHLAGIHVLHGLLTGGGFSGVYAINLALVPNLAMVAVTLPLVLLGMDVELAGRIFLALAMAALPLGVMRVHRMLFGRAGWVPLLSWVFVYNHVLMFGFLNYIAGAGLALLGFGAWLGAREARLRRRNAGLAAWLVVCFFAHLTAAFVLIGLVFAFELSDLAWAARRRNQPPIAWRIVPPVVACCVLGGLIVLAPHGEAADPAGAWHAVREAMAAFADRAKDLPNVTLGYASDFDKYCEIAAALALAVCAATGRVRVEPRMLLAISGLAALYFVVPHDWAGTTFIPQRLPVLMVAVALAGFDIRGGRALSMIATLVVILLVAGRSGAALQAWRAAERAYAPIVAAMGDLPRTARVYGTLGAHANIVRGEALPWGHMDSYATLRAGAYAASVFAAPSQDPIIRTPAYEAIARDASPLADEALTNGALAGRYDYVLAVRPGSSAQADPAGLRALARSGGAVLYQVEAK